MKHCIKRESRFPYEFDAAFAKVLCISHFFCLGLSVSLFRVIYFEYVKQNEGLLRAAKFDSKSMFLLYFRCQNQRNRLHGEPRL